ncbi:MAG: GH92 family glycosyl hydrolase [Rhodothermales bacterium]
MPEPHRRFAWILCVAALLFASCKDDAGDARLLTHVNPHIGTAAARTPAALRHSEADNEVHGQTFPGVGHPFGMTQWTPQTRESEKKCLSPYYYEDERIQGFRGSHWMSGSCTQDYGSVTLMPVVDSLRFGPYHRALPFSHDDEVATPSYYRVSLDGGAVVAEMTGTARAGFFRFTFRDAGTVHLVVQPNSDEGVGSITVDPNAHIVRGENPAHRIYQGWGEPAGFSGHFAAQFDRPFVQTGTWRDSTLLPGTWRAEGLPDSVAVGAYVSFDVHPGEEVLVKVGTSFTSAEEAERNLAVEIPEWDFDAARTSSESAWSRLLGRITVAGGTPEQQTTFYSAFYHASQLPRLFSDVSGAYPGFAGTPAGHIEEGGYYADFSVWDTYRAVHPLLTLVDPERTRDMVRSLIDKAERGGWLPIFPSWNSYTAAMIGDHATSIITDAYAKGIHDFDAEKAYRYMRQNAFGTPATYAEYLDGKGRRAIMVYLKYGFLPLEEPVREAFHKAEQVSRTLEYAYDDFVVGQMANMLGHDEDYQELSRRAGYYRNVIDPVTGFARGRHRDSSWVTPFDPANRTYDFITEGSPWHYTWYVPHDVAGLIDWIGGREPFIARLDTLFDDGHYWHGNEPSHQIAYLYAYAGAPWKTQQRVRDIMADEYSSAPGGLSGNDDAGQMSAWYVFSAIGLYPVAPGMPYYVLGSPLFETTRFRLGSGRKFTIEARGTSDRNRYIQSAELNGEPLTRPWIRHEEIVSGGQLVLEMGPEPNKTWGSRPEDAPPSLSDPQKEPPYASVEEK